MAESSHQAVEHGNPYPPTPTVGGNVTNQNTTPNINTAQGMAPHTTSSPAAATVLDPRNSPRHYYEHPETKVKREVWRPGDGNGSPKTDIYNRRGMPVAMMLRWRFCQSTHTAPYANEKMEPPHFVFLDDRAAYAVSQSDITRLRKGLFWPHDSNETGQIRARRPNRGLPVAAHPKKRGDDIFAYTFTGHKKVEKTKYVFSGDKNWKEIIYKDVESGTSSAPVSYTTTAAAAGHATVSPGTATTPDNYAALENHLGQDKLGRTKHGHNQYTPRNELKP